MTDERSKFWSFIQRRPEHVPLVANLRQVLQLVAYEGIGSRDCVGGGFFFSMWQNYGRRRGRKLVKKFAGIDGLMSWHRGHEPVHYRFPILTIVLRMMPARFWLLPTPTVVLLRQVIAARNKTTSTLLIICFWISLDSRCWRCLVIVVVGPLAPFPLYTLVPILEFYYWLYIGCAFDDHSLVSLSMAMLIILRYFFVLTSIRGSNMRYKVLCSIADTVEITAIWLLGLRPN